MTPFDFTSLLDGIVLLQAHHAPEQMSTWQRILNSNVINVVLVLILLGYIAKKFNLMGGIDASHQKIASELEAVERHKTEALAQLEEAKRRTANLNAEVEEILKNARESAETLSAQIIADAKTESGKIVDNARKRVELEQRSAMKDLERRLLSDALADARQELANSLTPADQRRSVETFLDELSTQKGGR